MWSRTLRPCGVNVQVPLGFWVVMWWLLYQVSMASSAVVRGWCWSSWFLAPRGMRRMVSWMGLRV